MIKLPKKIIAAFIVWGFITLPLMGIFISETYVDNIWFQVFSFSLMITPIWINCLWNWSQKDLGKINNFIMPAYLVVAIIACIFFANDYNFSNVAYIPAMVFAAFYTIALLYKNEGVSVFNSLTKKAVTNKITWGLIAILFISVFINEYLVQKERKHRNSLLAEQYQKQYINRDRALNELLKMEAVKRDYTEPSYSKDELLEALNFSQVSSYYQGNMTALQKQNYKNQNTGKIYKENGYVSEVKPTTNQNYNNVQMAIVEIEHRKKNSAQFSSRAYPTTLSSIKVKFELPSDKASKLTKGSLVSFAGKISDFGQSMGQYSILQLSHTQIIQPEHEKHTEVNAENRFSPDQLEEQPIVTDSK